MNIFEKLASGIAGRIQGGFMSGGQQYQPTAGSAYTIPQLDLSKRPACVSSQYAHLYQTIIIDDSRDYVAHPDSILLKDSSILTVYPWGHGRGAIESKISRDGGLTWESGIQNRPGSWETSQETPTVYRLTFSDPETPDKLILFSGNPKWLPHTPTTGGFNCSVSCDEGKTWSEFKLFYGKEDAHGVADTVVAMASLTQLKENGEFADKWMCFFHDKTFHNYKTILTFDSTGQPHFSIPELYFSTYRAAEKQTNMCEVEVVRSDNGTGNQLCLIARSNSKKNNSLLSFSDDEGVTWSAPKEVPAALNGERHKAEYTNDGRLFITFRSIERSPEKIERYAGDSISKIRGWYSEGWVAWIGTYEALVQGREGQYRIKLAHIYQNGQTAPDLYANADTGYCGNAVLADGTIFTCTYGCFDPQKTYRGQGKGRKGKGAAVHYKTSIAGKRINLKETDALVAQLFQKK